LILILHYRNRVVTMPLLLPLVGLLPPAVYVTHRLHYRTAARACTTRLPLPPRFYLPHVLPVAGSRTVLPAWLPHLQFTHHYRFCARTVCQFTTRLRSLLLGWITRVYFAFWLHAHTTHRTRSSPLRLHTFPCRFAPLFARFTVGFLGFCRSVTLPLRSAGIHCHTVTAAAYHVPVTWFCGLVTGSFRAVVRSVCYRLPRSTTVAGSHLPHYCTALPPASCPPTVCSTLPTTPCPPTTRSTLDSFGYPLIPILPTFCLFLPTPPLPTVVLIPILIHPHTLFHSSTTFTVPAHTGSAVATTFVRDSPFVTTRLFWFAVCAVTAVARRAGCRTRFTGFTCWFGLVGLVWLPHVALDMPRTAYARCRLRCRFAADSSGCCNTVYAVHYTVLPPAGSARLPVLHTRCRAAACTTVCRLLLPPPLPAVLHLQFATPHGLRLHTRCWTRWIACLPTGFAFTVLVYTYAWFPCLTALLLRFSARSVPFTACHTHTRGCCTGLPPATTLYILPVTQLPRDTVFCGRFWLRFTCLRPRFTVTVTGLVLQDHTRLRFGYFTRLPYAATHLPHTRLITAYGYCTVCLHACYIRWVACLLPHTPLPFTAYAVTNALPFYGLRSFCLPT